MTVAGAFLKRLRSAEAIPDRVVLVVAHPDDETLGAGGALCLLEDAVIVQLTDGAPDVVNVWKAAGVASRRAYAELRAAERREAFARAGWRVPVVEFDAPDQELHRHIKRAITVITKQLAGAAVVLSHPYEGGHPDHDAAAFIVAEACRRLGPAAPLRLEFASYHWNGSRRVAGDFWYDATAPTRIVTLTSAQAAAKARAVAAYASQGAVMGWFPLTTERYRIAPSYDFRLAPPPPSRFYERKAWGIRHADLARAMERVA